MRRVFPHVPAYSNWDCAGTQGCMPPPIDNASVGSPVDAPSEGTTAPPTSDSLARYSFLTQAMQSRCPLRRCSLAISLVDAQGQPPRGTITMLEPRSAWRSLVPARRCACMTLLGADIKSRGP